MGGYNVLQISPADNWWAVFKSPEDGSISVSKLICWALVSNPDAEDERYIEGIVEDGRYTYSVRKFERFIGYVYESNESIAQEVASAQFGTEEQRDAPKEQW